MTAAWLAVIGGIVTIALPIVRWWLSAKQRDKRNNADVRKKMEKMRDQVARGDSDGIDDDLHNLRL